MNTLMVALPEKKKKKKHKNKTKIMANEKMCFLDSFTGRISRKVEQLIGNSGEP